MHGIEAELGQKEKKKAGTTVQNQAKEAGPTWKPRSQEIRRPVKQCSNQHKQHKVLQDQERQQTTVLGRLYSVDPDLNLVLRMQVFYHLVLGNITNYRQKPAGGFCCEAITPQVHNARQTTQSYESGASEGHRWLGNAMCCHVISCGHRAFDTSNRCRRNVDSAVRRDPPLSLHNALRYSYRFHNILNMKLLG